LETPIKLRGFINMSVRRAIAKDVGVTLEELEALRKGFDLLSDHVIITDENANVLYANRAVEEKTGYSLSEVIGKNPGDVWGGEMPKEFYEKMWHTIKSEKKPFVGEVKNVRKDGSEYWQELHVYPILDNKGEVKFFIGIEPDITDRKKSERFKSEFVGMVSHQLKNPLTTMRWTIEWLTKSSRLNAKQRQKLESLGKLCKGLTDLVSDLLVTVKIGTSLLEKEKVDLAKVIEKVIEDAKVSYPTAEISLKKDGADFVLLSHEALVRQLLLNIVLNAVEYSPKKKKAKVVLSKSSKQILLSCQDWGLGIPEDEQDRIFERFYRASNAKEAKKLGTGLGLFTVRTIADNLGWDISFESKIGKGTTFFVRIPLK